MGFEKISPIRSQVKFKFEILSYIFSFVPEYATRVLVTDLSLESNAIYIYTRAVRARRKCRNFPVIHSSRPRQILDFIIYVTLSI